MKKKNKAFSLVEVMIVLFMTVSISALAFRGMMSLSKGIQRPKDMAESKSKLGVFVNGLYKFINNSFSVYMLKNNGDEFYYLDNTVNFSDVDQDKIYLIKDENGAIGRIIYDETTKQLEYYKNNTSAAQIMLKKVYRLDAIWNNSGTLTSPGTKPIFKFPHTSFLYDTVHNPDRPKVVILQFQKIVAEGGSEILKPITIPFTLMIEVNVSTFETV